MKKVLIIVGPTAVGKTAVSLNLAERTGAEIVSADSRQIYRFMDIATAKPAGEILAATTHHFINSIDPGDEYSAGQYGPEARRKIQAIHSQGKDVIVVGGSGLYVKALIDGIAGDKPRDEVFRKNLRQQASENGMNALHERLADVDPQSAARIHPNDYKRVERALEVYSLTGISMSELNNLPADKPSFMAVLAGLECDRASLYARIEGRIDQMLETGLIDETKKLLAMGYSPSLVSMESLGYREITSYLNGEIEYDKMVELFKQGSRNYAKRQLTWFKKDKRVKWFAADRDISELSDEILTYYEAQSE